MSDNTSLGEFEERRELLPTYTGSESQGAEPPRHRGLNSA